MTTQAAERAYAAQQTEVGRIKTDLTIEDDARLNWLPQETILFNNCAVRRDLTIHMANTAQLLMIETLVFGRGAMGETLTNAQFHDKIILKRNGEIAFQDAMRFSGNVEATLQRPGVANGAKALATILYAAPDAASVLPRILDQLTSLAGATLLTQDLLHIRILAPDSYSLRHTVIPVLTMLNKTALPRTWMT